MNDEQIVQMYWERDEKAIEATSEKYGPYCLSIAMNILGNPEDAEECVSDTYLQTWNSIPSNRPVTLSAYLGRICRNLSFNLYRKNRADKRGAGQIGPVLDELSEIAADPHGTEEELDCRLLAEAVGIFLSGLPAAKRNIFVCRYWYADSVKAIAERFGMSENSVSVTLSRLRTRLRGFLSQRGFYL